MAHAVEAGDVAPAELIPIAGNETSIPLSQDASNHDHQRNDWLSAEPDGPAASGAVSQTQANNLSDISDEEEISDIPVLQDGPVVQDGSPPRGRPSPLNLSLDSQITPIDLALEDSPERQERMVPLEDREQTPVGRTGQAGAARRRRGFEYWCSPTQVVPASPRVAGPASEARGEDEKPREPPSVPDARDSPPAPR